MSPSTLGEAMAEWERAMLNERKDWLARCRMLYLRPDYKRLDALAHDLRNGEPFSMEFLRFKRDYQSAVTWWIAGSLRPLEFLSRVRAFEHAVHREFERSESFEADLTYWSKNYQRVVRSWNRRGFVSRIGWSRLHEQRRRDAQWQLERQRRAQSRTQRAFLSQGRATMRQIRRVLRGQEPLPQPEFTPARSSQT